MEVTPLESRILILNFIWLEMGGYFYPRSLRRPVKPFFHLNSISIQNCAKNLKSKQFEKWSCHKNPIHDNMKKLAIFVFYTISSSQFSTKNTIVFGCFLPQFRIDQLFQILFLSLGW